jgi:hypothetical protein
MGLEFGHGRPLQEVVLGDCRTILRHVGVGGGRPIAGVHAQVVIDAAVGLKTFL